MARAKQSLRRSVAAVGTAAALSIATAVAPVRLAYASIFGEETAILTASLEQQIGTLLQAVESVKNLVESVKQLKKVAADTKTLLEKASPGSALEVIQFAQDASKTQAALEGKLKRLKFKLSAIDDELRLYSVDEHPRADWKKKATEWNLVVAESSRAAIVAQTDVERLADRARAQERLLEDSQSASGVVAQLQIVIRTLALLSRGVEDLQRSLQTGMRVTATMAIKEASIEEQMQRRYELSLEGYTDKPPAALTHRLTWPD